MFLWGGGCLVFLFCFVSLPPPLRLAQLCPKINLIILSPHKSLKAHGVYFISSYRVKISGFVRFVRLLGIESYSLITVHEYSPQ